MAPSKSSWVPINSIRYPDVQGYQSIANLYHYLKKSASRLQSKFSDSFLIKIPIRATRVPRQGKESSENFFVFTELFLHAKVTICNTEHVHVGFGGMI